MDCPGQADEGEPRAPGPAVGRALEILDGARTLVKGTSPYLFPNRLGKQLEEKQLRRMLGKHKIAAVPHGFRSSFRDWAAEETDHPREVIEAALAHVVQNRVEAAYRRTDLFERRRRLMDDLGGVPSRREYQGWNARDAWSVGNERSSPTVEQEQELFQSSIGSGPAGANKRLLARLLAVIEGFWMQSIGETEILIEATIVGEGASAERVCPRRATTAHRPGRRCGSRSHPRFASFGASATGPVLAHRIERGSSP